MQIAVDDHCHTAADVMASARRVQTFRRASLVCPGRAIKAATSRAADLEAVIREKVSEESAKDEVTGRTAWIIEIVDAVQAEAEVAAGAKVTFRDIMTAAHKRFGVSFEELRSPSRKTPLPDYRHCICWCARELTSKSLPEIGRDLGGRDHTSILSGVRKVERSIRDGGKLGVMATRLRDAVQRASRPAGPAVTAAMGDLFPIPSQGRTR